MMRGMLGPAKGKGKGKGKAKPKAADGAGDGGGEGSGSGGECKDGGLGDAHGPALWSAHVALHTSYTNLPGGAVHCS